MRKELHTSRLDSESGRISVGVSEEENPWGNKNAKMHPAKTPIPIAAAIRDPRLDNWPFLSFRPPAISLKLNPYTTPRKNNQTTPNLNNLSRNTCCVSDRLKSQFCSGGAGSGRVVGFDVFKESSRFDCMFREQGLW